MYKNKLKMCATSSAIDSIAFKLDAGEMDGVD